MTLANVQEHAGAAGAASPYRWVILFIVWIAFLLTFIDRLAWANVAVSVGESFGLTIAALGVFVTAFYVGYVTHHDLRGLLPALRTAQAQCQRAERHRAPKKL